MRDRLVHRWLATQRTYDERDVKRAYYLSSEFLTGRSLGLCLLNLGLYDIAEALAAERGFDLGDVLEQRGRSRAWATAASDAWPPASWTRWPRWTLPAVGYGIRYDFGIFEQRIENGRQVELHDNWLRRGNPWELPRNEDAQTVRLRRPRRDAPRRRRPPARRLGRRPPGRRRPLRLVHRRAQAPTR